LCPFIANISHLIPPYLYEQFVALLYVLYVKLQQSLDRPSGFRQVDAPRYQDCKVVSPTHRLPPLPPTLQPPPPGNTPGTHFF